MVNRFRLFLSVFVFFVVLLGGLALVRLFSWVSLSVVDRVFYVGGGFLFVFALCLSFFFSRLDVPELPDLPDLPDSPHSVADSELMELRKELHKPTPIVGSPNGLVRDTSEFDMPIEVKRLVDDVSMYENRNILKPPLQSEHEKSDNEYSGVF